MSKTVEVRALIITGSVGVGKTRVLDAVTELLRSADMSHLGVDMDRLCDYWPWVSGDPHNRLAGLETLRVMCSTARNRGIDRLVLAEVIEQQDDLSRYAEAAEATSTTVVRLVLPDELIPDRLSKRDRDGDSERELSRSRELADLMERHDVGDAVIVNDRTPVDTAHEVLRAVAWFV